MTPKLRRRGAIASVAVIVVASAVIIVAVVLTSQRGSGQPDGAMAEPPTDTGASVAAPATQTSIATPQPSASPTVLPTVEIAAPATQTSTATPQPSASPTVFPTVEIGKVDSMGGAVTLSDRVRAALEDFPVPPGQGTVMGVLGRGTDFWLGGFYFEEMQPADVIAFYDHALPARGWMILQSTGSGSPSKPEGAFVPLAVYERDGVQLRVEATVPKTGGRNAGVLLDGNATGELIVGDRG